MTLSSGFERHWNLFADHAKAVISSPNPSDETIQSLLNKMTQLLFGLDEPLKAQATGALDMIMGLAQCSSAEDQEVSMVALKAVKASVVRNPVGRRDCRAAGVFEWLKQSILIRFEYNSVVVEEGLTCLAAVCLSNDLNALQATIQFRSIVEAAANKFDDSSHATLHQKVTYLRALFSTMEDEQKDFLDSIRNDTAKEDELWSRVRQAELALRSKEQQGDIIVDSWQDALRLLDYYPTFNLLDPLRWELHYNCAQKLSEINPSDILLLLSHVSYCCSNENPNARPDQIASMLVQQATLQK